MILRLHFNNICQLYPYERTLHIRTHEMIFVWLILKPYGNFISAGFWRRQILFAVQRRYSRLFLTGSPQQVLSFQRSIWRRTLRIAVRFRDSDDGQWPKFQPWLLPHRKCLQFIFRRVRKISGKRLLATSRPSVRMEQLDCRWRDFHEIWY